MREPYAMASHFITVLPNTSATVKAALLSQDSAFEAALLVEGSAEEQAALRGTFTRDSKTLESPNAPLIIRAFERICRHFASADLTIEAYEDEDRTPLLWDFVWSEWDGGDDLGLPLSPYGVPAVTWHGPGRVVELLSSFESLHSEGEWDRDCLSLESLDLLLCTLRGARAHQQGVFVFTEQ
jgi:hypothetical protein